MHRDTVRTTAFAMLRTDPAFPPGPCRFINREYFIIQYLTDPQALRRLAPEPLELAEPMVNHEFIRMPDLTGFGDYTESGQVIPVAYQGQRASCIHLLFLTARQEKISQHAAAVRRLDEKQPSRTFVTPEQLAGTVAFLCWPMADQITGTAIAVDGGWTAR